MSEPRVLPTEPGVFYVKWGDDTDTIARISIKGDYDAVARFFNGADVSVKNRNLSVIAPVPSRDAVEAAVLALQQSNELLDEKKADCTHVEGVVTIDYRISRNNKAIAGLTGNGGCDGRDSVATVDATCRLDPGRHEDCISRGDS